MQTGEDIYQQTSLLPQPKDERAAKQNGEAQGSLLKIDRHLPPSFMLNLRGYDYESILLQFGAPGSGQPQREETVLSSCETELVAWLQRIRPQVKFSDMWGCLTRNYVPPQRFARLSLRSLNQFGSRQLILVLYNMINL